MPTRDTGSCPMCTALTCRRTRQYWRVPNCCTHGLHDAQPNELRVFRGGVFHAQLVFNNFALPTFNTAPSKGTDLHGYIRALTAPCVTNSLAVDGEPNAWTRTGGGTKSRHCSAFWTKTNCSTDNFGVFREYVQLCGLTFELSGRQRQDGCGPE